MTPSTISVAVIVLSATLSVFLSPDRSFAQSTADVTTVSLISPHPLMHPNISMINRLQTEPTARVLRSGSKQV